ncbi:MAG TPA: 4-hydroxy-tetrahydrodipicolinate reductase [Pseudomonadota bacterium]|nr:4-hydroxy-tetrahydrodipicolinate reductase [Pseudomonadota bacterium]
MSNNTFPSERTNPDESSDELMPSSETAGKGGSQLNMVINLPIRVGVYGAFGRMGQILSRMLLEGFEPEREPRMVLTAAVEAANHPHLGRDIGPSSGLGPVGLDLTDDLARALSQVDVMIDFSTPGATVLLSAAAADTATPLVIGTTSLHGAAIGAIDAAANRVPIVCSANMSPGVNVLISLLKKTANALPDHEVEIVELHHRHKKDAPSGTALLLADTIESARGRKSDLRLGRSGMVGPRGARELGIMAVRGGDVVGEHTVFFFGNGERVELTHRAQSREVFAKGALWAARWVVAQNAGIYGMEDVLGVK